MAETTIPENPPAFPDSVAVDAMNGLNYSRNKGMTLRDYFAAKVMGGLLSDPTMFRAAGKATASDSRIQGDKDTLDFCAGFSYLAADALLSARVRGWQ